MIHINFKEKIMNFNLKDGKTFVLEEGDTTTRLEIENGSDYICLVDGNRPKQNKKIVVTDKLFVCVKLANLFARGIITICEGPNKWHDLYFGRKQNKEVEKFVSILEENGICVFTDKLNCTEKRLTYFVSHEYILGLSASSSVEICGDNTLDVISGGFRKNIKQADVSQISIDFRGDMVGVVFEGEGLKGTKIAGACYDTKTENLICAFKKKTAKPVLNQFVENLRKAGFTVVVK